MSTPPPAHTLTVQRTARYYTLGAPGHALREVWFVLHGYGQLAGYFVRHFRHLDDGTRLFVAPEALSRFYLEGTEGRRVGATWMTREDRLHEIDDYVAYLDAVHDEVLAEVASAGADRDAARVHLLGFSQGTATACRWAALGRVHADRLTCWAGGIPPDLDLDAHGDALRYLTLVLGTEDEYIDEARFREETERLRRHGVPHRVLHFDGSHRLDTATLKRLAAADLPRL